MPNFSAQCVKGVQGIGYVCAFFLSLVICVPMSMHQDQFRGRCLLFSTGVWQEKDGQFKVDWASQAYCNFTIFVSVIMFVISLFQFIRFLKFFYKGRDSSFLSAFLDVIVCAFMTVMTLTAALFVTLGFKVWCEEITRRFENCSDATDDAVAKSEGVDSSDFFNQFVTAQFGIWTSFTAWFTLSVFSFVKLCRYHHEENLRVSMARERKRLINEEAEVPPNAAAGGSEKQQQQQQQRLHRRRFRGRTGGDGLPATVPEESDEEASASSNGHGRQGPFDDELPAVAVVVETHEQVADDATVQVHQRQETGDGRVGGNDHDRCSTSSVGSSSQASGSLHKAVHGNQILRVDTQHQTGSDAPWY